MNLLNARIIKLRLDDHDGDYQMNRRDFLTCAAGLMGSAALECVSLKPSRTMEIILWCWDTRMTWDDEPETISHKMGQTTTHFTYPKRPESFLVGFKRLVDYMAGIGMKGVIIWGFLRDSHGGIQAAKELCDYAHDRGVLIIPGVGLCSYGGFYYEGDHPFNLTYYLKKHPDRRSKSRTVKGTVEKPVLDPSLAENQQWWRDGLEWMMENFRVGGFNFEMGDFMVNYSDQAVAARKALGFDADENILDIVVATRDLIGYGLKILPDALFINATYRGFHQLRNFPRMPFVNALPEQVIWEHTLTHMVNQPEFPGGFTGAPQHRQYGYLHWFNPSTMSMDKDYVSEIARVFPGAHKLNFEFIGTYGEVSSIENPLADRNYRAQVAWARNPELTIEDFL